MMIFGSDISFPSTLSPLITQNCTSVGMEKLQYIIHILTTDTISIPMGKSTVSCQSRRS